jgi:hypothetical protein
MRRRGRWWGGVVMRRICRGRGVRGLECGVRLLGSRKEISLGAK